MDVVVPPEFQRLFVTDADRPIVKVPAPVLRQVAAPVAKITDKHRLMADNMVRIMKEANGVGLAAPQVSILERLIVISPGGKPMVLFNPVITQMEGEQIGEEGCLSIPGLYGDVKRANLVEVEAYDRKGKPVVYEMEGFAARIVQHEVDHLDGVLFIDKVDVSTLYWKDPVARDAE
ncbi:MAG: peptide deformylase [Armatimonadetes bacterium]|nr:peptide deformylase [Armatimonadota bacterium]